MVSINAYDEFGFILWYYAPLAYFHHVNGTLSSTNSKIGSKAVFYFSDNHFENELHNEFPFRGGTECYNFDAPSFTNDKWLPPPFKKKYKKSFVKKGRLYAVVKRKYVKAGLLVKSLFKDDYVKDKIKGLKIR